MLKYKQCIHKDCQTWYKNPQVHFHKDNIREDGFSPYCKVCVRKYQKKRYQKDRDKIKEMRALFYETAYSSAKEKKALRIQSIRVRLNSYWEEKGML